MDVKTAIEKRRAYRSLKPTEITDELIRDLAGSAQLSPSCFNNQPWRFVFVKSQETLLKMREAMTRGNEWTHHASLIIAVFSRKELDCIVKEREYYLFGMGLATAFLILRATELGLVAHPIAGFHEDKVKEILGIPEEMRVITLVNVGLKNEIIQPELSEKQIRDESERPPRKLFEEFVYIDKFTNEIPIPKS
jgi:nitroreductase